MSEEKTYERFNIARRVEHLLLVVSFFLLGLTGLVLKFHSWGVSQWIINSHILILN